MTNKPARERDIVERMELIERIKQMIAERKHYFDVEGDGVDVLLRDCWAALEAKAPSPQPDTDVVELRQKLRMIISHASGGALSEPSDIDRSVNDICVEISRHKTDVWNHAQEVARRDDATAALNASTPEIQRMREALNWAETYDPQMVAQIRDRAALKQDEENHD